MLSTVNTASYSKNFVLRYIRLLLVNQFTTSLARNDAGGGFWQKARMRGKEAHQVGYFDPMHVGASRQNRGSMSRPASMAAAASGRASQRL